MANTTVINFKKTVLTTPHINSYNQLTATPVTVAAHAASLGIGTDEATRRLSLLVDEGLAVSHRSPDNPNGAAGGGYTTS